MTMKDRWGRSYRLVQARDSTPGMSVLFDAGLHAGYRIEQVEVGREGQIVHRFGGDTGSSRYHPGEWLRVEVKLLGAMKG